MLARNWLPKPSPLDAPATSPAMSTKLSDVGTVFTEALISASTVSFGSGTATTPVFGSIVQNGKLAAWACDSFISALKSVDLPTLGRPTMPVLSAMLICLARGAAHACRRTAPLACAPTAPAPVTRTAVRVTANKVVSIGII
eukprot:201139-Prymnesium_polylepis.1